MILLGGSRFGEAPLFYYQIDHKESTDTFSMKYSNTSGASNNTE